MNAKETELMLRIDKMYGMLADALRERAEKLRTRARKRTQTRK